MANLKISELTADAAPTSDDLIVTVHDPGGTPASRKVTLANLWATIQTWIFAEDAGASDTYTATLSPAPSAYVTGQHYRFKANTANTGACTINFNGLGAKAIKKAAGGITTDLADNDIRAGQWVDLVYDGTNMQMQSLLGNATPAGVGDVVGPGSATDNALARFDGTTGKLIQNSTVTLDDTGAITVPEMAAPSTPGAGKVSLYAKADGLLYSKDDAGLETVVTGGGGGGSIAPLTIIDANTVEQKNSTNVQTFRVYKSTTDNHRFSITNVSNVWELASQSDATANPVNLTIGSFKFNFGSSQFTTTSAIDLGSSSLRWSSFFGANCNITGEYRWNNLTRIQAGVDGFPVMRSDAAAANATGWIFGTNDVNGVRLKRTGTRLEVKLGGDSAYTQLTCEKLGVNNSAAATSLGSVVKKTEIFDAAGASLGFVAIYDAIT